MTVCLTLCQFATKFGIHIHEAWRPILNGVGDPLTFSSSANIRSDFGQKQTKMAKIPSSSFSIVRISCFSLLYVRLKLISLGFEQSKMKMSPWTLEN